MMIPLVLLIVVGFVAIIWLVRKYMLAWMKDDVVGPGFTLADLRQLHKSGQMSDEEFERAKAQVVQGIRKAAEEREKQARGPEGLERK